jgi:trehalose-phosphatase
MQSLLEVWPDIIRILETYDHVLVLSDFDGTLAPIVEQPEQAAISETTRSLLDRLARSPRYTVGIISGRALSDLKSKVGLRDLYYGGNHGLEMEGPDIRFVHPKAQESMKHLKVVDCTLREKLSDVPGAIVEDKGLTISVHYRMVSDHHLGIAETTFAEVLRAPCLLGRIAVTTGKKVWEVRPVVAWDKGAAVEMVLKRERRRRHPHRVGAIFFGDDRTDESAFRAVERHSGISVFVGAPARETSARYWVRDHHTVQDVLRSLASISSPPEISIR